MTNEQRAILAAWNKAVQHWRINPDSEHCKRVVIEWYRVAFPAYPDEIKIHGPGLIAWGY